jgi:hypothetical protein
MLSAELNFYRDARWTTHGLKIGTLFFLYRPNDTSLVGFIPTSEIERALAMVVDPVLSSILGDPLEYVSMLAETIPHTCEQSLVDVVCQGLPSNLRLSVPRTWPPDEGVAELIMGEVAEGKRLGASPVGHKEAVYTQ